MLEISGREIILQRLARNGLSVPFADALDCVRSLAGIQSQFQQWAEVSIMNRSKSGATTGELADSYARHDIINLWGQRQTLHMYVKDDWDAVSDLYEPKIAGKNYIHNRLPDDFAFLMERVAGECAQNQMISRAKLQKLIAERTLGRHSEQDYLDYSLILICCLRGVFFGLPEKPGIKTFVSRGKLGLEPWREDAQRAAAALQSFMLRYFQYYGPATLADFCHWSGFSQGAAKRGLEAVKERLTVYAHNGREYFAHGEPAEAGIKAGENGVFLLGKFDPLFVSYRHKDWIIPPEFEKRVWRSAGWVEAVVLDGGKAAGTWRHTVKGRKMSLEVSQFAKIKAASRKKIEARAAKLAAFWGKSLDSVIFD